VGNVLTGYVTGFRGTAEALLFRIQELETRDYPTALSKQLLRVLREAIKESQRIVEELVAQDDASAEGTVMRHGVLLSWFHQLVHLISSSVGNDVPRWAIQPMKYEIAKYLKSEVDILIVGGQEGGNFAYDYRLDRLDDVLKAAYGPTVGAELVKPLPRHMAVFHFPFGERDNVLAHGAFFHEVGHQIDIGIRGISQRVSQAFLANKDAEIRSKVREYSNSLVERIFGKTDGEQTTIDNERAELLIEEIVKAVQAVLSHWAREFCADLIAARILGPAYAMVVVISPALLNALRIHAPTHPATILRLRVIIDLLASKEAGDYFTECDSALEKAGVRSLLHEWQKRCKDAANEPPLKWHEPVHIAANEQVTALTVSLAEELSRKILEAVVSETTDQGYYAPTQYSDDIDRVLPTLERGITINESVDYENRVHRANEIATIFNVGVAQYLAQQSSEGRTRLNKLLRKSIELSQIQLRLQELPHAEDAA
jgi:hypothetical protein